MREIFVDNFAGGGGASTGIEITPAWFLPDHCRGERARA